MLIDNKKDRYPDDGYKIDPIQKTKRSVRVPLSALALSWFTKKGKQGCKSKCICRIDCCIYSKYYLKLNLWQENSLPIVKAILS